MKKTIGILAHVDAGKTTFSEQILFHAQAIRTTGRVDHGNAFLDIHPLEKQRGITIFSDQACFERDGDEYFWVDTLGHVDFAAEMERAVSVMDYAVLIISASEGVQSHTETVWSILKAYGVPVFIFVNKMDHPNADLDRVMRVIHKRLSTDAVNMDALKTGEMDDTVIEEIAGRDEELLEMLLEGEYDAGKWKEALISQIRKREIFPVFSGSALRDDGIKEFLSVLCTYTRTQYDAAAPFGAKVYKVRHGEQGERICFFKVLSGTIRPRTEIVLPNGESAKLGEMRRYHGAKFRPVSDAAAGDLCAVAALPVFRPGDTLGNCEAGKLAFQSEPMMAVSVLYDASVHADKVLSCLKLLEDEDPTLSVVYSTATKSIDLNVMGTIQLEVIRQLMQDRYGVKIDFGPMRVLYMETIAAPSLGIGHYEPLRHYAEVQLRLVPGKRGSGIRFESLCHVDDLALNWQRLICSHVFEKTHRGVLIGAPLTDICVELLRGKDHLKHTEGGDFRESTYRAIRNALMYAESILLEPVCRFELRAPSDCYGRILGDLARMHAQTEAPDMEEEMFTLEGEAPFAAFAAYPAEFMSFTRGRGILTYRFDHYAPCLNAQEIIDAANYDVYSGDSPDSVFCSHGAGFVVPWNEVRAHAHLDWQEG